ncbi:MAG: restriction endonuclease [Nanoarchaeota archaeon]|nr:restriction endonuclease [Nanoarchaeota archaeon]
MAVSQPSAFPPTQSLKTSINLIFYYKRCITIVTITKSNGERVKFDPKKLLNSLMRAGAEKATAEEVIKRITPMLYDGIYTGKLYRLAFRELKKLDMPASSRYAIKWAITRLGRGNEGFSFEQFTAKVFERMGYKISLNQAVKGRSGITHEIDLIAEKGKEKLLVECKHHSKQGMWVNVQTPLYVYARYLDLKDKFTGAMIITNSRFSEQSEMYSKSVGLKLMGWSHPEGQSLQNIIDIYAVYPITVLHTVDNASLGRLLVKNIVTVSDILSMPVSRLSNLIGKRAVLVRKEAEAVARAPD